MPSQYCPCYYGYITSPHQGPSLLDLQLPVQAVPLTTKVVSSNPAHGEVQLIQHYVKKFVSDLRQVFGFSRVLLFPPHWYFVKPFIIITPHEPFTRKSNGPCVTEVQCTLQRGEIALCTNNRIRGQSIARLKLPVDIA